MPNSRRRPSRTSLFEPLEPRQLLSTTLPLGPGPVIGGSSSIGTIHEMKGVHFTADLGTFFTIAPASNIQAAITWGDGSASAATIKASPTGVDTLSEEVDGAHTYLHAGIFHIHVNITKAGPTPDSPRLLLTTLDDRARVSNGHISLQGTLTGTFTMPPHFPDLGKTFLFTGAGTAGDMAHVSLTGNLHTTGKIAASHAAGSLTLTNSSGSITLHLLGPLQHGFSPAPHRFIYQITTATGSFLGSTATGQLTLLLASNNTFQITIT